MWQTLTNLLRICSRHPQKFRSKGLLLLLILCLGLFGWLYFLVRFFILENLGFPEWVFECLRN